MQVRRAKAEDAVGIASVHVAAWRTAYAGILPETYLAGLSLSRQAAMYDRGIAAGHPSYVAVAEDTVVGFVTAGRARSPLADGEVETLYVLDDWRDQGAGRQLMQRAAGRLARAGCRSLFLWVLRDNGARWFYQRLGGRAAMQSDVRVAGTLVPQTAYVWNPIELLLPTPAPS